ncbi:FAD binding domain-containing protein [Cloacibacillus evryensis]|uniref:FAD binding domain-containing protein n=1 Tax=Cloacibacillus evryensis TaxID=508460 RepID=UPI0026E09E90|nr:FAD binding domain-containing protein [Cloacibacillus evryensis]
MYIRVKSLAELEDKKLNGRFIAGGTDLVPLMKLGLKEPRLLIDVTKLPELHGISLSDKEISIGAAATLTEIAENADVLRYLPALAQSAEKTASLQIRNVGTIGGNVMQDRRCIFFNQSPSWRSSMEKCFKAGGGVCLQIRNSAVCRAIYYSDTATALVLYEAEAEILRDGRLERIPAAKLIAEHSAENGLRAEESALLLVRLHIPMPPVGEKSGFLKYNVRSSIDFPLVNFALRLSDGARPAMAVAGAVGPAPLVLEKSSRLLDENAPADGAEWTEEAVKEIKAGGGLIRESVVPPKVKMMSYKLIGELLKKLNAA